MYYWRIELNRLIIFLVGVLSIFVCYFAASQKVEAATPKHVGLANSTNPELQKLAEYENVYGGAVTDTMMVFTDTPKSQLNARTAATSMSNNLKEFAKYGIKPLVIMEPVQGSRPVDFQAYADGRYDPILDMYFKTLKNAGLTDVMLGTWVFFPESNTPLWGNTDPGLISANITRSVQIQKQYYPDSQASVMLNSMTYDSDDTDWANGRYASFVPYLAIPKGLINSFGLQGFPWVPPKGDNTDEPATDPSVYLPATLAARAANYLRIKAIWFNTGTFGSMYTDDWDLTVNISPQERADILNGVVTQAQTLKNQGYNVSVNLFSQDKSDMDEATDWSYWKTGHSSSSPATHVFIQFVRQLQNRQIPMWLFDTE